MMEPFDATVRTVGHQVRAVDEDRFELTLFVNGASELSVRAIADAKRLCETHLENRYKLSVVDVNEPDAAADFQMLASPTLFKLRPLPQRKHVGDLSNTERVLEALGITSAQGDTGTLD